MDADAELLQARRAFAVLVRRLELARAGGLPTAVLEWDIHLARVRVEVAERLIREANSGYRPLGVG